GRQPHPRPPGIIRASPGRDVRPAARARERARAHGTLRHSPRRSRSAGTLALWRQPAEDRRRARDGRRFFRASRRAAHARRGRGRHRVHPRATARRARRGQGHFARVRRDGGDSRARGPRRRDVRRPHRWTHAARRGQRRPYRPAHDRRARGRGGARMTAATLRARAEKAFLPPVVALLIALVAGDLLILSVGQSPASVFAMMLQGTWGNAYGLGQVLYKTTTLICTGLCVSVGLRAGLFNIGGEGQLAAGGFAAALTGLALPAAT